MIAAAPSKQSCQDDQGDVDRPYEKLHTSLRRYHKELLARLDSQDAILRPGPFFPVPPCPTGTSQHAKDRKQNGFSWMQLAEHGRTMVLAMHIRAHPDYILFWVSIDPARSCRQIQSSMLEELLSASRDELILHGLRGDLTKKG